MITQSKLRERCDALIGCLRVSDFDPDSTDALKQSLNDYVLKEQRYPNAYNEHKGGRG